MKLTSNVANNQECIANLSPLSSHLLDSTSIHLYFNSIGLMIVIFHPSALSKESHSPRGGGIHMPEYQFLAEGAF